MTKALYHIRTEDGTYRITKLDTDLNMESSYVVSAEACECPQGHKPTCRHRKMLPLMIPRADTPWFLDYDTRQWHDPTGQGGVWVEPAPQALVEAPEPSAQPEPVSLHAGPEPVMIPPSLYDRAAAEGHSLEGYKKQELIPPSPEPLKRRI